MLKDQDGGKEGMDKKKGNCLSESVEKVFNNCYTNISITKLEIKH